MVCVDCPLRNSEAQSGSAGVPRPAAVDAIETIEHAGCVFGRNTWSANARADSNETSVFLSTTRCTAGDGVNI